MINASHNLAALLEREDVHTAGNTTLQLAPLDFTAANAGELHAIVTPIAQIWRTITPHDRTAEHMIAILRAFVSDMNDTGTRNLDEVTETDLHDFICDPNATPEARSLRKNTLHGAYLALTDAGLFHDAPPTTGIDPNPDQLKITRKKAPVTKTRTCYADRDHTRPATHDEMLITRLATRLAATSRSVNLAAAALAVVSSGATTREAPQVRGTDMADGWLTLVGLDTPKGREENAIAARKVRPDEWAADAIAAWEAERNPFGSVDPEASVLYSGKQATDSNSAQVGVDKQVRNALDIADLSRGAGLTAGSFYYWAGVRHVTDFASLETGAAVLGIDPLTLRRRVLEQGDRAILSH